MPTIYKTHRRINAPIEFHGLKAQYILYAGASIIGSMILFAILFISGVSSYICLLLCFGMALLGVRISHRLSRLYGPAGYRRRRIARRIPNALRSDTRRVYYELKKIIK